MIALSRVHIWLNNSYFARKSSDLTVVSSILYQHSRWDQISCTSFHNDFHILFATQLFHLHNSISIANFQQLSFKESKLKLNGILFCVYSIKLETTPYINIFSTFNKFHSVIFGIYNFIIYIDFSIIIIY